MEHCSREKVAFLRIIFNPFTTLAGQTEEIDIEMIPFAMIWLISSLRFDLLNFVTNETRKGADTLS